MNKAEFIVLAITFTIMVFIFSCHTDSNCDPSQEGSIEHGTMTYEGQTYKTVRICAQTWMAENLNYAAENSGCYEDKPEYCERYGRLYNWATANSVCPSGWHLPSDAEWNELIVAVGGTARAAGKHLRDKSAWYLCDPEGMYFTWCKDTYGFSALPGGKKEGRFIGEGEQGYWWSSSFNNYLGYACYWNMSPSEVNNASIEGANLFSVRCLRD